MSLSLWFQTSKRHPPKQGLRLWGRSQSLFLAKTLFVSNMGEPPNMGFGFLLASLYKNDSTKGGLNNKETSPGTGPLLAACSFFPVQETFVWAFLGVLIEGF